MTTTFVNGTGNVIGSHSAQDFTWAGRAETETATHSPEMEQPYAGPTTEPFGSEVQFGAERKKNVSMPLLMGSFAAIVGFGGLLGLTLSNQLDDLPFGIGALMKSIKISWDSKDFANKTLMAMTYISLFYLGSVVFLQQKTIQGASMSKGV